MEDRTAFVAISRDIGHAGCCGDLNFHQIFINFFFLISNLDLGLGVVYPFSVPSPGEG